MSKTIVLHRLGERAVTGITTFGSYFGRGEVQAKKISWQLQGTQGEIPVNSRITAIWPDGSVKWAAHAADAGKMGSEVRLSAQTDEENEAAAFSKCGIQETDDTLQITAGTTSLVIHKSGDVLFENFRVQDHEKASQARLVLLLSHPDSRSEFERETGTVSEAHIEKRYGRIHTAKVVENGPVRAVVKVTGSHAGEKRPDIQELPFSDDISQKRTGTPSLKDELIPFSIYIEVYKNSPRLHFTYTFGYDADEKKDFLKGLALEVDFPLKGALYNRHIRVLTDHGSFHEAAQMMLTWRPRIPKSIYYHQTQGEFLHVDPDTEEGKLTLQAAREMPAWDAYTLWQDSASHYQISKKTCKQGVCQITGLHGHRSDGVLAVGGENGGLMVGVKDFWQRYPSALRVSGLTQPYAQAQIWLYPPQSSAYDFRHYEDTGYSQTYYEGFDVCGASVYGIAATCEFELKGYEGEIPTEEDLQQFDTEVQRRALYLASPEYYHTRHAFGYWSLPSRETPAENFLEDQLETAVAFYKREQDERSWYGMFDYGDFMHTYDPWRHTWRYDMGGFAWQNTELVPTYWLWYYFMRTQRPDVFELASAMTRHCSEVDIYHFGPIQGLGSRHNVRHWGCSCKEARIAMAGHDRFLYYLTGDWRLGDVMTEVSEAQKALAVEDPLRFFTDKSKMTYPTHARSGPDWSSLVSDWMTQWERTGNTRYLKRIRTGIEDIKRMNLGLLSGPDFEFDPKTCHLLWKENRKTGGSHLSICQGAEQTWLELTDLLDDPQWTKLLAQYGAFYPLDTKTQNEMTDGEIGERKFSFPFMAAGVTAFAASYFHDRKLGEKVWDILLSALPQEVQDSYFRVKPKLDQGNQKVLMEIPGVSTNVFAQWCLNTIVALDFVRDCLPERVQAVKDEMSEAYRRKD